MNSREEDIEDLLQADLTFPPGQQTKIAALFRITPQDLFVPVNPERVIRARKWRTSPVKRALERTVSAIVWKSVLEKSTLRTVERIHGPNPVNPWFWLEVGFLGMETTFRIKKVKTMIDGAQEMERPLRTSLFAPKDKPDHDQRAINAAAIAVRKGRSDEYPQVGQVAHGEPVQLAGIRGCTGNERIGLGKLIALRTELVLGLPPQVQVMLGDYPKVIACARPQPAIFTPLSAANAKDTSAVQRVIADMKYLEYADPLIDMALMFATLPQIARRVGAR